MSVFGNIMSSIFGHAKAQTSPAAAGPASKTSASSSAATPVPSGSASVSGAPKSAATQSAEPEVDVEAVLTRLAGQNREKLEWRTSIVDLMKLHDLDSGLSARKQLAKELNYSGDSTTRPR